MRIENITAEEFEVIDERLTSFNGKQCNLTPTQVFNGIYKCMKVDGEILGGISGDIELQCALHIKILWIDESLRGKNIGKMLLNEIENEARLKGAEFSYLETFDFQAREFYEKNGYEVFSKLEYASGNTIYFMKRKL